MEVVEWNRKENISKTLIDVFEMDPKLSFNKESEKIFFFIQ